MTNLVDRGGGNAESGGRNKTGGEAPAVPTPSEENSPVGGSLERGIEDARQGRINDLGSFAAFAEDSPVGGTGEVRHEVRWDEPGEPAVDEVIGYGFYHIERMHEGAVWLHLGPDIFWISANRRAHVRFTRTERRDPQARRLTSEGTTQTPDVGSSVPESTGPASESSNLRESREPT